jgi:peptidoglycan-N-acetylglucosamine deacetylase
MALLLTGVLIGAVAVAAAVVLPRDVTAEIVVDDRADVLGLEEHHLTVTAEVDTMRGLLQASDAAHATEVVARFHPPLDETVEDGDRLEVEVAVPVTVVADGREHATTTFGRTVGDALDDADVAIRANDRVTPSPEIPISGGTTITLARVEITERTEEVTLEHGEEERHTDDLLTGESEVATEGRDGLRRDTYEVVLVDGEEESRERVDQEVVEEPADRVVLIGAGEPEPPAEPDPEPTPSPIPPSDDAPVVHLTFDDGPNATWTPQILDLLAAYDARATLFVVGREATDHPEIMARIVDEGHVLGNHTWSHARLTEASPETIARELRDTQEAIEATTGRAPTCLRPPFGARDGEVEAVAADIGLDLAMWDVDPRDWERPGTDVIVEHVQAEVGPGDVVLLHDGFRDREQTVAATERLLEWLTTQGYRITPMPDCS